VSTIEALIARRNYGKALELIRGELARRPHDGRLRLQQADVLILAGRAQEAVGVLMKLADEHAADGFAAKAIAVLKRIEKIAPGRRDVEQRLARLIQDKTRGEAPGPRTAAPALELGLEEFDPSSEIAVGAALPGVDAGASEPIPDAVPEPVADVLPEPAAPAPVADDLEGLDYISVEPEPEEPAVVSTPLFEGLSHDELVAVIHGLKLLTFSPGDILVAEGAPGDSLFILTSGIVKAFVKGPRGQYVKVTELSEGAFFGEISVLTGRPRTATITAATPVEVLELAKPSLDEIVKVHPRVMEVLRRFHEQRARDTVATLVRGRS
jgi:hypothetical protein